MLRTYTGSAQQIADPTYRAQQDAMTPLQRAGYSNTGLVNDMLPYRAGTTTDEYNARFEQLKSQLPQQMQSLLRRDPVADLPQSRFKGTGDVVGMATNITRDPNNSGQYYLQDQRGNLLGAPMTLEQMRQFIDPATSALRTDLPSVNGVTNYMYRPGGNAVPSGGSTSGATAGGSGQPSGGSTSGSTGQPAVPSGSSVNSGTISSGPEGAYQATLNPTSMTVEGRLQGLLTRGNPLLDMAMTKAIQQANARGLLNSSIAAESGQAAVIQNALPIAQQDASTYAQTLLQNTQFANQALQQNRDISARSALTAQQGGIDMRKIEAQGQQNIAQVQAQGQQNIAQAQAQGGIDLQKIGAQGQQSIAQTQAQTQGQLSIDTQRSVHDIALAVQKGQIDTNLQYQKTDADALTTAARNNTAAYQNYVQAITAIDNSSNLNAEAKTVSKREIGDSFVGFLRLSGAAADVNFQSVVDGIFNASAPKAAPLPAPVTRDTNFSEGGN